MKPIAIIGYSGHSYVIIDIFESQKQTVVAYCEQNEKLNNPYHLTYLGSEKDDQVIETLKNYHYFIAIGNNYIRRKIYENLVKFLPLPTIAIHTQSFISRSVQLQAGTMVSSFVTINSQSQIGEGVILNTNSVIEHECKIGDFCHIAPSAVLCGSVEVGENSFVGANAVVKQGVKIGKNVVIGAGSVVTKDIPDDSNVVGINRFL